MHRRMHRSVRTRLLRDRTGTRRVGTSPIRWNVLVRPSVQGEWQHQGRKRFSETVRHPGGCAVEERPRSVDIPTRRVYWPGQVYSSGCVALSGREAVSRGPDPFGQAIRDVVERTRLYFEPYLADIRLSKQAIMEQDADQLELSLTMLDTLISHPEQFGLFRMKFSAEAGAVVTRDRNEAQFEIGIRCFYPANNSSLSDCVS